MSYCCDAVDDVIAIDATGRTRTITRNTLRRSVQLSYADQAQHFFSYDTAERLVAGAVVDEKIRSGTADSGRHCQRSGRRPAPSAREDAQRLRSEVAPAVHPNNRTGSRAGSALPYRNSVDRRMNQSVKDHEAQIVKAIMAMTPMVDASHAHLLHVH
jgi:hypothetical protein